ncbi:hypothetical protein KEM52_005192 [Ascosphaera acerosa]|nr:hypothetical protein KEM52_005192 [Ascosphaera acerosa]
MAAGLDRAVTAGEGTAETTEQAQLHVTPIRPFRQAVEAMNLQSTYRPLLSPRRTTASQPSLQSSLERSAGTNPPGGGQSSDNGVTVWAAGGAAPRPRPTEEEIIKRGDNWSPANMVDYRNLRRFYRSVLGEDEGQKAVEIVLSDPAREICRARAKRNTNPEVFVGDYAHPKVCLLARMLRDGDSTNDQIWVVYRELPSPGVRMMDERSRGLMLHRFAKPRRRCRADCVRYLSLVDDMVEAGLHLSDSLWNCAIFLAAKHSTTIRPRDLKESLGMWRRMEYQGQVRGGRVTFNILFDIAIKAGQFKVAEKIMDEMLARGLEFSRNGKVSRIYLQGLLKDADGVREAYNDFVASGELVDTVVLNCVMSALMKAGEATMAEKIYERMKDVHEFTKDRTSREDAPQLYPSPSDNYLAYRRASERLSNVLGASSLLKDSLPEAHEALQSAVPLTPDARTFHILLSHHAIRSGDFSRVTQLLHDMRSTFELATPQSMIYVFLFQGFATHGGVPGSEWTLKRLRRVWTSFIRAYDESVHIPRITAREQSRTRKRLLQLIQELEAEHGKSAETASELAEARRSARADRRAFAAAMEAAGGGDSGLAGRDEETSERTSPVQVSPSEAAGMQDSDAEQTAQLSDGMRNRLVLESTVHGGWRNENSVYLGRALIIAVLNAFNRCGSLHDVCDAWEAIDVRWRRSEQRTPDVLAVKAELRRLLRGEGEKAGT